MSRLGSKKCWEITQCKGTDSCPARQQPNKNCWEIAKQYQHMQDACHVCDDCIVAVSKQQDEKSASLLRTVEKDEPRSIISRTYIKCPVFNLGRYDHHDERRRVRRVRLFNGDLIKIKNEQLPDTGKLVDISETGLAFTYAHGAFSSQQQIVFDLYVNDISLENVSAHVVSDMPLELRERKLRRCGLQFDDLRPEQMHSLNRVVENMPYFIAHCA